MLSITDTTFDLFILQLVLHAAHLWFLLLRVFTPVRARSEDDILADGSGIGDWASFVLGRETKFGPGLTLCDAGIYNFFDDSSADSPGCFHLFALIVESPGDYCLRSILVGCDLLRREFVGCYGIIEVLVIGPVRAAFGMLGMF
jgi:hypothetical protein